MTQRLYPAEAALRAYELGFENEQVYRGCGQCAIGAIIETLGLADADEVFRAATAFAAGIGMMGDGSCGGGHGGPGRIRAERIQRRGRTERTRRAGGAGRTGGNAHHRRPGQGG